MNTLPYAVVTRQVSLRADMQTDKTDKPKTIYCRSQHINMRLRRESLHSLSVFLVAMGSRAKMNLYVVKGNKKRVHGEEVGCLQRLVVISRNSRSPVNI